MLYCLCDWWGYGLAELGLGGLDTYEINIDIEVPANHIDKQMGGKCVCGNND